MQNNGKTIGTRLAVVIVNFRTPGHATDCLASLLPELDPSACKAVVVDNDSRDGSVEILRDWKKNNDPDDVIVIVESGFNGGFSYGNNLGIRAVQAQNYLLLNSDTRVLPGAIDTLLQSAAEHPEAGIVSPRLESANGEPLENCFRLIRPFSEFCKTAQTGLIDSLFSRYVVPVQVMQAVSFPQWTSFACVLIKADLADEIGLLDDGFFMYFEDTDYCLRARNAGWEIVNNPDARVVHFEGGSSSVNEDIQQKNRLPRYYYESRTRYFYKAFGRIGLTMANLFWTGGFAIASLRRLLGRRDKAVIRNQWRDIWFNFFSPLGAYTHPDTKQG